MAIVPEDGLIQEFVDDNHLTSSQQDELKFDDDTFGRPKGLSALEDALLPPRKKAAPHMQPKSHPKAQPVAAVAAEQPVPAQRNDGKVGVPDVGLHKEHNQPEAQLAGKGPAHVSTKSQGGDLTKAQVKTVDHMEVGHAVKANGGLTEAQVKEYRDLEAGRKT